jgi:hypothetical protein
MTITINNGYRTGYEQGFQNMTDTVNVVMNIREKRRVGRIRIKFVLL